MSELYKASKWMKFMAVLGFVGAGIMVLAGLLSLAAPNSRGVILIIVCVIMAALIFVPARFLFNYANRIQIHHRTQGSTELELAFQNQRSFWIYNGVMYGIYVLLIIIALLAGSNGALVNYFYPN